MIIGICGKSGSGKSTLAQQIVKMYDHKAIHLDIDTVGHNALMIDKVKEELEHTFGSLIMTEGNVDRKKLGNIVFNSRREMQKLTDITWQYMQIGIDEILNTHRNQVIILDWILLPQTKYFSMCDLKILLDIPYEIRKQRAIKRDHISQEAFGLREKASIDFDPEDFDQVLKTDAIDKMKELVKIL